MSNVLAFVSIKGGVGKTTVALETATALVKHFGKRVLLVDANFSAPNIGLYLDLTSDATLHDALSGTGLHNAIYEAHGVDIVPASLHHKDTVDIFKLKNIIEKFRSRYDFIILDSSPHFEELKPVVAAADKIFLVTSPDHVTLHTTLKAGEVAKAQKTPIHGLVVNRIRNPRHEYNLSQIEDISSIPVLAQIQDHKKMAQATNNKMPISELDETNTVAKEIKRLAAAICGSPEESGFFTKINPFNNLFKKERVNRDLYREQFYQSQL